MTAEHITELPDPEVVSEWDDTQRQREWATEYGEALWQMYGVNSAAPVLDMETMPDDKEEAWKAVQQGLKTVIRNDVRTVSGTMSEDELKAAMREGFYEAHE